MRVVFAGGGTGGHVYPALAVAEELMKKCPDSKILFIGGTRGIEQKIIGSSGFPVKTIPVIGFPRKLSLEIFVFPWKLGISIIRSLRILSGFKPSLIMATGGYVSGPPVIAARFLKIPVTIQEPNSFPGITNRKLARFADMIFLGFQDAKRFFTGGVETIYTGIPVRKEIGAKDRESSARSFGLDPAVKTLLVFGGSQGSLAINKAFSRIVEPLAERGVQVLWQAGDAEFPAWKEYDGWGGKIHVLPYITNMADAYAASDLVLARAGAMSIAEITACGIPAIFIPLPWATANHQEYNARSIEAAGGAKVILEKNLTPELLLNEIVGILESDKTLKAMGEASQRMGKPDAARIIAERLIKKYGGKTSTLSKTSPALRAPSPN
jgi:UDP-N-acetylglucosamine--N-acetylmuramyl-(pentapeptide) pyrophosphoryl-undecaprenol N-acetylglucosamine transferase